MTVNGRFSQAAAREIGDRIGVDWATIRLDEFQLGLTVELEHGAHDPQTDVTNDDPLLTGKIVLAHLKELPDYYTRLAAMEAAGEAARRMCATTDVRRPSIP